MSAAATPDSGLQGREYIRPRCPEAERARMSKADASSSAGSFHRGRRSRSADHP